MEDGERGNPEQTGYPEPRTLEIPCLLTMWSDKIIDHSARRYMTEGKWEVNSNSTFGFYCGALSQRRPPPKEFGLVHLP